MGGSATFYINNNSLEIQAARSEPLKHLISFMIVPKVYLRLKLNNKCSRKCYLIVDYVLMSFLEIDI